MSTQTKALLVPVLHSELANAREVCRREGKVAFASKVWELSRDVQAGMPVLFYASRSGLTEGSSMRRSAAWIGQTSR